MDVGLLRRVRRGRRSAWVIVVLFVRNKPEDKGLVPDGSLDAPADEGAAEKKQSVSKVYKAKESKTLKQAFKTPAFWLFIGAALPLYFGFNVNVSAGSAALLRHGHDPGIVRSAFRCRASSRSSSAS